MDTPSINVSASVADPVSATLQSAFNFGTAFFTFLNSPEGQIWSKQVREDSAAAQANALKGWLAFKDFFK